MSKQKGEQGLDYTLGETNEGGSPNLRDPERAKVAHPSLQRGRRNQQLELGTTGRIEREQSSAWTGWLQLSPRDRLIYCECDSLVWGEAGAPAERRGAAIWKGAIS